MTNLRRESLHLDPGSRSRAYRNTARQGKTLRLNHKKCNRVRWNVVELLYIAPARGDGGWVGKSAVPCVHRAQLHGHLWTGRGPPLKGAAVNEHASEINGRITSSVLSVL